MALYNCHHDGDQYRITKFSDLGEVESSYLCDHAACECPAGVRDTCRHRQMLPVFLERELVNSHLFINWDLRGRPTVDFQGRIVLPNLPKTISITDVNDGPSLEETLTQPRSQEVKAEDFGSSTAGSTPAGAANKTATEIANTPLPEMRESLLEDLVDRTHAEIEKITGPDTIQQQPWRRF